MRLRNVLRNNEKIFLHRLRACAIISNVRARNYAERINIPDSKEVRQMSNKCEICGKGQVSGNNVSHSNRHTKRKWNANIQTVRINDNGTVRRAKVCTRCLRSGKVERA